MSNLIIEAHNGGYIVKVQDSNLYLCEGANGGAWRKDKSQAHVYQRWQHAEAVIWFWERYEVQA